MLCAKQLKNKTNYYVNQKDKYCFDKNFIITRNVMFLRVTCSLQEYVVGDTWVVWSDQREYSL